MAMEGGDIDARAISIKEKLSQFTSPTSNIVTIPRVPERLRLGENDAYEPRIISFGPYHHGKPMLQPMEKYKWQYLNAILSRNLNLEKPLESYIGMITKQEEKIRSYYSGEFDIGSKDFVEMVLRDGCFIVEYFLQKCSPQRVCDELDSLVWSHELILYDILLLENQLPFFIVKSMFDLAIPTSSPSSFTSLAIDYLNRMTEENVKLPPPESVHHLLHLYHSICLYTPEGEGENMSEGEGEITREGEGENMPEGEGQIKREGEGESTREGEGESMPEGEGEITREGEGESTREGEGENMPEGEGEIKREGEGESTREGEGENMPKGEEEITREGEGENMPNGEEEITREGEGENMPEGEGESTREGEGENTPEDEGEITREGEGENMPEGVGESTATIITIDDMSDNVTSMENQGVSFGVIPSATGLQESGIKFIAKRVNGSSLDVEFCKGKMMIPTLTIDSFTKSKFRNLIAFEQFFPNFDTSFSKSFCAYAEFLDSIVSTPEDVALLLKKGIISHILGSNKDVANILNHLNGGTIYRADHYLDHLYKKVRKYQQKRRHRWYASLMHNYFNSPWAVLGIVAASILLVLTILQTIFSGYSAFHSPPSPSSH